MESYGSSPRSAMCGVFDCFSAKENAREKRDSYAHKRASRRIGMNKMLFAGTKANADRNRR